MNWLVLLIALAGVVGFLALLRASVISASQAQDLLKDGARVVDVREPAEFNSSHLPGALNLPLSTLRGEIERQIPDKSTTLLLHCLSGGRSAIARQKLRSMGYPNVFNLGSYGRAANILRRSQKAV